MKIVTDLSVTTCRRSASGWMPSRLFPEGTGGAAYDPSAPGTLWADTAGTLPATVGGAVARMDDISGNGHHMTQATAAKRPTLGEDAGGRLYLDFDGVDDWLVTPTFGFSASGGFLLAYGGEGLSNNGRILSRAGTWDDGWSVVNERWTGTLTTNSLDAAPTRDIHPLSVAHVGEYALRDGLTDMAWNGDPAVSASATGNSTPLDIMSLGARSDGARALAMRLYGFVAVEGGVDAATRGQLRRFLAAKTGVTL